MIFGVIRRHLFGEDEDDVRTIYVDILKALYDGDMAKYNGDATLATWLIVYARSRSFDFFRKRYGRQRPPKWQEQLSDLDKDILKFFFVQRLPLEVVVSVLNWNGCRAGVEEIIESIGRIESVADPRSLAWVEEELDAKTRGIKSLRMLHQMIQLRLEYEEKTKRERPDEVLAEKDAVRMAERIREAVQRLPDGEREVLSLWFEHGHTAARISDRLGLGGERRAYTVINRILRKLRRVLARAEE